MFTNTANKRKIFYVTGSKGSGKTSFVQSLTNSLEIEEFKLKEEGLDQSINYLVYESIVVTNHEFNQDTYDYLLEISLQNNRYFFDVNLSRNESFGSKKMLGYKNRKI